MSFNKKAIVAAVALGLGTAGMVNTASAALVLTFSNNTSATTALTAGTQVGFAAGSEFHVSTPYGSKLNDGDKDIISGGETWTFAGNTAGSALTGVGGTTTNTGQSGTSGQAFITAGVSGFPIASAPGSHATLFQGADFLGAGDFTILANTTTSASGVAFGPATIASWGGGNFTVHMPVVHVQWADGSYIIGGDGDGNATHNQATNLCSATTGCTGPGMTFNGTYDGAGNFKLYGSQTMTKDEVTVGGFNKNTVEFALGGTYAISTTVIPVPAAAWLLGSGLLGMVGVARRRRSSK